MPTYRTIDYFCYSFNKQKTPRFFRGQNNTKMKRIMIFLTVLMTSGLLCLTNIVYGQNDSYLPFSDNCEWSVNSVKYRTSGDTVINNLNYLKIYIEQESNAFDFNMENARLWGLCRNDIEHRQVFFLIPAGVTVLDKYGNYQYTTELEQEYLFYDFSLQLGNSVVCYQFDNSTNILMEREIQRVESIRIFAGWEGYHGIFNTYVDTDSLVEISNGATTKRILVRDMWDATKEAIWYEGAGANYGFIATGTDSYSTHDGSTSRLLCFEDDSGAFLHTGFDMSDNDSTDCFSNGFASGIGTLSLPSNISIYPNPTNSRFHIKTAECTYNVKIYNIYGQCVYEIPQCDFSETIDLSNQAQGPYLIKVYNNKELIGTQILLKQ